MNTQANARLTPLGRQLLCERIRLGGWTVEEAPLAVNVSERTTYRWLPRYDAGGPMTDRSSRPHSSPTRTPVPFRRPDGRPLRPARLSPSPVVLGDPRHNMRFPAIAGIPSCPAPTDPLIRPLGSVGD